MIEEVSKLDVSEEGKREEDINGLIEGMSKLNVSEGGRKVGNGIVEEIAVFDVGDVVELM